MTVSKQDLYDAFARHNADLDLADHEPRTNPNCAICEEINRLTHLLEDQEKQGNGSDTPKKKSRYIPKVIAVEDAKGNEAIYRITTKQQEPTWLKEAVYYRLTKRDQDSFFIGKDIDDVISLSD